MGIGRGWRVSWNERDSSVCKKGRRSSSKVEVSSETRDEEGLGGAMRVK